MDNLGQNTKDYLLHQIRLNFKHPKFLDLTKVEILLLDRVKFKISHYLRESFGKNNETPTIHIKQAEQK